MAKIVTHNNISVEPITIDDLNKINSVLLEALNIKDLYSNDPAVDYKVELINIYSELLYKILFISPKLSNDSQLKLINLLHKINAPKEALEIIRSKVSAEDLLIASERLGKKSQSAFELK